jgi:signal transduction histidine kinase
VHSNTTMMGEPQEGGRPGPSDAPPRAVRPGAPVEHDVPRPVVADRSPTAQAVAEAVLAEEEAFCRFLPDAYLRTDAHGVIRKANGGAAELLRRPRWALEGKPLATFVELDRRRDFRVLLNDLGRAAAMQQWTLRLALAPDQQVTVAATIAVLRDASGGITGARWLLQPHVPSEIAGALGAAATGATALPPSATPPLPLAEHEGRYAALLARASAVLASSFDMELTLRSLARLVVPTLADWCFVDLVEPQGLRRLAVTCSATEDHELTAALAASPPRDALGGLRLGPQTASHLAQPVTHAFLATMTADAAQLAAYVRLDPVGWLSVPLVARGHLLGVLTLVTTGSQRPFGPISRAVAEDLAQRAALAADNARLYQLALRASEVKSNFLATMSHELRTPLAAIMGYTELLRDGIVGPLQPKQDELLGRVRESSDHLLGLVEEILGYARLEAREERAVYERAEVAALLDQAVVLVEPLAHRKALPLRVEAPAGQLWFDTDVAKVRQILVNLLGNAIKFTDEGEVRVAAWAEADDTGAERIVFEVRDTGIGIAPDQLPHIFDSFWQVEQRATRRYGGTGLGLSVVRQLARLLGGDAVAESEEGRGSRFRVWLPLRRAVEEPAAA